MNKNRLENKRTIIFDFGNVLIDLDFDRCFETYRELTGLDWSMETLPSDVINVIHKYDRGHISDEAFIWTFQQYSAATSDPRLFIKAWNSLIGEIQPERFEMLESLRENYNLCILSNINNLHLKHIHRHLKTEHQVTDFEDRFFDRVFYSHHIGKRKPDTEIYDYVKSEIGVSESNILFIDDLPENISAARSKGWHGQVHDPKNDIVGVINNFLHEAWG